MRLCRAWMEPSHDNRRCGFAGRAGRIVWVWRFTWHFGRFPSTVTREHG
jgi:hypothetical protein